MSSGSVRPGLLALWLLACGLLVACGGQATRWDPAPRQPQAASGGIYVVQRGDTLYQIAFRHGLDWRDLSRWNGLGDGELIFPGQRLRLHPPPGGTAQAARRPPPADERPPATAPPRAVSTPPAAAAQTRQPGPSWTWPAQGELAYRFGDETALGRGLGIRGRAGQPVVAAAPGRVVYTGSGLVGYGEVIIIKHNQTWLSAYGHTRGPLVGEGDEVTAGQRLAAMGEGPGQRPLLHFEIRVNGEPVDPLPLLPAR
ncbi:MAG: LysM peptidoglycan-binding domain-containing protein [Gammaproteobacteria bacterium]|nr:MAG: LysM peptidoglycan-binding domain-containing protein [Gammaproteobacteria bacterium]